jgi:hypothetical protein
VATHSSQSRGRDGSPLLPHCHAGWIDVVDMRAPSALIVSEVLRDLDGEKAEVPDPTCTIPNVGSEQPLRFPSTV